MKKNDRDPMHNAERFKDGLWRRKKENRNGVGYYSKKSLTLHLNYHIL